MSIKRHCTKLDVVFATAQCFPRGSGTERASVCTSGETMMGRVIARVTIGEPLEIRWLRMMIAGLAFFVIALVAGSPARAAYVFEQFGPRPTSYLSGTEFNYAAYGPTAYDVSGSVSAVLNLAGGLSLGCFAADYQGFSSGSIALVSGNGCSSNTKAGLAQAAGAIAIIIGADRAGNPNVLPDTGVPVAIPAIGTSLEIRSDLFEEADGGMLMVRLAAGDVVTTVPRAPPPILEQLTPDAIAYTFRTDFNVAKFGPYNYDISGPVFAVLNGAGTDLSLGCDAADYSGFALGSIAFLSRGICTFNAKAALAQAAGAIGILIGNTIPGDALALGDADIPVDIPAQSTSLELRNELFPLARDGTLTVRLAAGAPAATAAVPEPATWAMMIAGFGAVGMSLRRRRGKPRHAVA